MKGKSITRIPSTKENGDSTRQETFCLSKSKKNRQEWEKVEDYSLEWNANYAQTIFRIVREYDNYKKRGQWIR